MRYQVELYEKDNDVYTEAMRFDIFEKAKELCDFLAGFCKEDNIRRTTSDGHSEPYDWVEIYDRKTKQVIYTAGGIE